MTTKTVVAPLFPLPGFVLFPRTMVPLHIFEPRYRQMVQDVLAGDQRIATAQLRPGWEDGYEGRPPVYRMVTLARILHEERLPQGRYNIIVEGIQRARIVEEPRTDKLYRLTKVAPVTEAFHEDERDSLKSATEETVRLVETLGELTPDLPKSLTNLKNIHLHPGIIADQIGQSLVSGGYERQGLLEEENPLRRLQLVNVQLRTLLARHVPNDEGESPEF
ncbi:MAG: LON peptidase substrate-binding domain-containing protein [Sumerlaeia bacterium]